MSLEHDCHFIRTAAGAIKGLALCSYHTQERVWGREEGGSLSIVRKQELSKCPRPKPVSSRKPVWGMQFIQGEPLH